MIKKVICLISLFLCIGCHTPTSSYTSTSESDMIAKDIMDSLQMTNMSRVKDRVVVGMIFSGDKDALKNATLYRSNEEGNYDMVGVFYPTDIDASVISVESYLDDLKNECNIHYPQEVFKISNAIEKHDDNCIILVITTDIENARTIVEKYIS